MTVFVAGIHGVGKTFLAAPAAERLGLKYATASQLIRAERGNASWNDSKQVNEVAANQAALIASVNRIKRNGEALLLDGHLVLRRAIDQHERLSPRVFHEIGCHVIVLVTCSTHVVLERLAARGDLSWRAAELEAFARAETEHAETVSRTLEIPLIVLDNPTRATFDSALMKKVECR